MLQYSGGPAGVVQTDVPAWVTEWLGRRRKTTTVAPSSGETKSIGAAQMTEPEAPVDPKFTARNAAAAAKRRTATQAAITDGLAEMEA